MTMEKRFANHELAAAYRILFDAQIDAALTPLRSLEAADVRRRFRRKALETHPDRARLVGKHADALSESFKRLSAAYELLQAFIEVRKEHLTAFEVPSTPWARASSDGGRSPAPEHGAAAPPRGPRPELYYSGAIPAMPLRLAQFLYYSGRISWQAMIRSVCWQRSSRPAFGELALSLGLWSDGSTRRALAARRPGEKVGEVSLRLGLLTRRERDLVLARQLQQQPRIGGYFVRTGLVSEGELCRLVGRLRTHNSTLAATHAAAQRRRDSPATGAARAA